MGFKSMDRWHAARQIELLYCSHNEGPILGYSVMSDDPSIDIQIGVIFMHLRDLGCALYLPFRLHGFTISATAYV